MRPHVGHLPVRRLGILLTVWVVTWSLLGAFAARHHGFDFGIYHDAVRWWWSGHPLYGFRQPHPDGLGFTYPPFGALALTPLALLPFEAGRLVMMLLNLAVVTLGGAWLARPVTRRLGWPAWYAGALLFPLAVALEPIRETLGYGQVNLLLAALVLGDAVLLARGHRLAGAGIGVAAAIKLIPVVFVLYLIASRQWRAACTAAGTAAAATLVAAGVDWGATWQYWTGVLWRTSRVGRYDSTANQSLLGLVDRLADSPRPPGWVWAGACAVVLAAALLRAERAHRAGVETTAFVIVGLTGCLLSPISWTHHLVWVYPALIVLVAAGLGRRRRSLVAAGLTYALFASSAVFLWRRDAPHHGDLGVGGILVENSYVLAVLALVLFLPTGPPSSGLRPDRRERHRRNMDHADSHDDHHGHGDDAACHREGAVVGVRRPRARHPRAGHDHPQR